ncbi:MAG: hypothetical protein ABIL11_16810 [Chloroflexota bacterium]
MLATPVSQRFEYQDQLLWIGPQPRIIQSKPAPSDLFTWQNRTILPIPSGTALSVEWEKAIWKPWYEEISTVITPSVEESLNILRSFSVAIPQPAIVRDYLIRHLDMTGLLVPICDAARQRFGVQAQLSLESYRDPEIEDEYLTLYVRQKQYDENMLRQIKEIRKSFEGMLAGKTGWFLLTTDFQPPR